MPRGDDGKPLSEIGDGNVWVFAVSDMPGVRMAIGRPEGQQRPGIFMWSNRRSNWLTLGRFSSDLAGLAAVEFMEQMAGQINRTQQELEDSYVEKLNKLSSPGESDDTQPG